MMRSRILAALFAAAALDCTSTGSQAPPVIEGTAAVAMSVVPNPIIANHVSGSVYDFPFSIALREVGGASVEIEEVSIDVTALGGLRVYSQSYDADEIRRRGYSTSLPARGEIRYEFNPRKDVPDERLFSAVSAELSMRGRDSGGAVTSARTNVTVRR
ncbi:MAG TPA: hypothetical protein VMT00_16585 [Thermoanaerobaculia bacterium]|nr:hypothetical protein [Thermoanaerobaculia bacterium]